MKTNYNWIRNIFAQRAISSSYTEQVMKLKNSSLTNMNFIFMGELDYWFWRYVFMKDLTKKYLTNKLLKAGFDNLTVIEMIDALNQTRIFVKDTLEEAKENI